MNPIVVRALQFLGGLVAGWFAGGVVCSLALAFENDRIGTVIVVAVLAWIAFAMVVYLLRPVAWLAFGGAIGVTTCAAFFIFVSIPFADSFQNFQ